MRTNTLIIVLFAVALSGCANTPKVPLANRLEGKTPDERHEILRRTCLTEAEWDLDRAAARQPINAQHRYRDSNTTRETSHLKTLCRELSALPAILRNTPIELKMRTELIEKCRREIEDHTDLRSKENIAHMSRVQELCEGMTGFSIPTEQD
ncbi:MAG: hypothetical protein HY055_09900 [Magnetospirillum sp.]|uniref:Lipoprotein n=1 Tax=Paramagnetospirillum magnetotacticum MS-1 TaxID=272627 RepID=A0A0C2YHB0_PARME|nr:hypothetical protein [Paramagnetospirillum magnetotacticum]KIL99089.1 hypothetical protein CCC_01882 [Paramagnetospirillum magnetotacticum MS-1]MBI3445654.1 hypothetical protein [Magnetospirillum sp.]